MLNELIGLERGLSAAGIPIEARHPDIKDVGKGELLRVRLDPAAAVAEIDLLGKDRSAPLWTLRDGQHNSFPFVQVKKPLLAIPDSRDPDWYFEHRDRWKRAKSAERRRILAVLAQSHPRDEALSKQWLPGGLQRRLHERLQQLDALRHGEAAAVPAVIERFLTAVEGPQTLVSGIVQALMEEVSEGSEAWLDIGHRTLVEACSLYFDVARNEFSRDVADRKQIGPVSRALADAADDTKAGRCALTGGTVELLAGKFPQPTLPQLGQTYLFSKNKDIPAAGRYGRFGTDAFPLGRDEASRMAAALTSVTAPELHGKTWQEVPGERRRQIDLLIAFVQGIPDASLADALAQDRGETEGTDDAVSGNTPAAFKRRTERIFEAVRARVGEDFQKTPVQLCLLRKVDPANRKAIYHRLLTVRELKDSAEAWHQGELNTPDSVMLWTPGAPGEKAVLRRPPHVAPLQLPILTRRQYTHGGRKATDLVGLSWSQAFALFLREGQHRLNTNTTLRHILRGYGELLSGSAHALRLGLDHAKEFDRIAALRAVSVMGVLLARLDRRKEEYVNDAAFKLGQLLAVADVIHIGYCADVRNGQVPPTLLGNAVLPMAQSDPTRALSLLSRRWKPYAAWAKGTQAARSKDLAVRSAVSQARRIRDLGRDLHNSLPTRTNDAFRAELLLGYIAGLPKATGEADGTVDKVEQED